jgi:hypothetical protein
MTADRPDRFFPTTLPGGFLHVRGIPDWGPWNDGGIEYSNGTFPFFDPQDAEVVGGVLIVTRLPRHGLYQNYSARPICFMNVTRS